MHLGAVYDVLYKAYNNVTPIFCYDGSAEHPLAYLYGAKCEDKAAFSGLQPIPRPLGRNILFTD